MPPVRRTLRVSTVARDENGVLVPGDLIVDGEQAMRFEPSASTGIDPLAPPSVLCGQEFSAADESRLDCTLGENHDGKHAAETDAGFVHEA